jgi:hypothetical protein
VAEVSSVLAMTIAPARDMRHNADPRTVLDRRT